MTKLTQQEKCLLMFALGCQTGEQMANVDGLVADKEPNFILAKKLAGNDVYVETPKEKEGK